MNNRLLDHLYFLFTISLTSYGLSIIKWRIAKVGVLPQEMIPKLRFLLQMFLYPLVLVRLYRGLFGWLGLAGGHDKI